MESMNIERLCGRGWERIDKRWRSAQRALPSQSPSHAPAVRRSWLALTTGALVANDIASPDGGPCRSFIEWSQSWFLNLQIFFVVLQLLFRTTCCCWWWQWKMVVVQFHRLHQDLIAVTILSREYLQRNLSRTLLIRIRQISCIQNGIINGFVGKWPIMTASFSSIHGSHRRSNSKPFQAAPTDKKLPTK